MELLIKEEDCGVKIENLEELRTIINLADFFLIRDDLSAYFFRNVFNALLVPPCNTLEYSEFLSVVFENRAIFTKQAILTVMEYVFNVFAFLFI